MLFHSLHSHAWDACSAAGRHEPLHRLPHTHQRERPLPRRGELPAATRRQPDRGAGVAHVGVVPGARHGQLWHGPRDDAEHADDARPAQCVGGGRALRAGHVPADRDPRLRGVVLPACCRRHSRRGCAVPPGAPALLRLLPMAPQNSHGSPVQHLSKQLLLVGCRCSMWSVLSTMATRACATWFIQVVFTWKPGMYTSFSLA